MPDGCAEFDTDYLGSDFSIITNVQSHVDCWVHCRNAGSRCQFWTWTNSGFLSNPNKCFLKEPSGVAGSNTFANVVVSGQRDNCIGGG